MYGVRGEPLYTREQRKDIREEIERNRLGSGTRVSGGVLRGFARELKLDAARLARVVLPVRREVKRKGSS